MAGDPWRNGLCGSLAGSMVVMATLPMDAVKTRMQVRGIGLRAAVRDILAGGGTLAGARHFYRGAGPAVSEVALNRGTMFGVGAAVKRSLPQGWSEPRRDAVAGAVAALIKTALLHPLDTLKTRLQLRNQMGTAQVYMQLTSLYHGFLPAATRSSVGMAIWLVSRNLLERSLPESSSENGHYPKHFVCGALSSVLVDLTTFPLDTLKKNLQASTDGQDVEVSGFARRLYKHGGMMRFYRGYAARLGLVAMNGAIFNSAFVFFRTHLVL